MYVVNAGCNNENKDKSYQVMLLSVYTRFFALANIIGAHEVLPIWIMQIFPIMRIKILYLSPKQKEFFY